IDEKRGGVDGGRRWEGGEEVEKDVGVVEVDGLVEGVLVVMGSELDGGVGDDGGRVDGGVDEVGVGGGVEVLEGDVEDVVV
ncbi:hypothetical protein, partial [Dermacoccus nishinomiyaensis]|uniref:hypothetical protein n=1 Tax=Dermacoccus nishinomiyaensis TaxID=1274 RepID=UPI001642E37C